VSFIDDNAVPMEVIENDATYCRRLLIFVFLFQTILGDRPQNLANILPEALTPNYLRMSSSCCSATDCE
jgi:hypothetical protein